MSRTEWVVFALLVFAPALVPAMAQPDVHLGVATCASTTCHGSAAPAASGVIPRNEYVTWSRFDPHAGAYRTLFDERSLTIARRLGIRAPHESADCLGCHADNRPPAERGPRFQVDDGIGCEACHGGATDWLATHDDSPRSVTQGMVALEDPRVRARVCTACHVGDGERFASHRLMAAGHPRLAFELDTFTELWRTSGGREHYIRDADYVARKPVAPASQVWAAGLAASARAQARSVAQRYTAGGMPDFALFNCYSCHRSMRLAGAQEDTADAGTEPGRLRFEDGVLAVLDGALGARPALRAKLGRDVASLQSSSGLGHERVVRAAVALAGTLDEADVELAARPLSPTELRTAREALARRTYVDYAGAEQAAMGLVVLLAESGELSRRQPQVDRLFEALEHDDRYDPRRFARLGSELRK